jgi:putative Holliday junction resolvase
VSGRTRILGIDYGTVRVGLAISDPDRKIAFPLSTHERRNQDQDATYFKKVAEDEEVGLLLVGLPIHLDGRESEKAKESIAFGQWLNQITGLPVAFADERFSTVQAEAALWSAGLTHKRRKARRDQVAAQIVLQAYLDSGCPADAESEGLN